MARRARLWSYAVGERGRTVTVYERTPGGVLYVRAFDPIWKKYVRRSLGHRNRARAKWYVFDQAAKLHEGDAQLLAGRVTLARVLAEYETYRTPKKQGARGRGEDRRRIEMWARMLGGTKDPHAVSMAEWERFITLRSSGAIDPRGQPVVEADRQPVRPRTVGGDCLWLNGVFRWAARWRDEAGRYLMQSNPTRGYEVPVEKNPRRPVATPDRYRAIRSAAEAMTMRVTWTGKRRHVRSYLSELLTVAHHTGRRIGAVCKLRREDLRLERTPMAPHGAIRWPADTDKAGKEWVTPINADVRQALDRLELEAYANGCSNSEWVFPAPADASQPLQSMVASRMLMRAEKLSGVPPQQGSLWHAYRRGWATARKGLSDVDVAAAGGWSDTTSLKRCYQQADEASILQVVLNDRGGE